MSNLSRRDFLKVLGVGSTAALSAVALAGCSSDSSSSSDSGSSSDSSSSTSTSGDSGSTSTSTDTSGLDASVGTDQSSADHKYTSIISSINSDPGTLAPFGTTGSGRNDVRAMQFEKLISLPMMDDTTHTPMPVLAKRYEAVEDSVYEVEIYDYIYDWEGNHMTADDVYYSYQLNIEDGNNTTTLSSLEKIEVVSDYVLRFYLLNERSSHIEQVLAQNCVTQAAWEASSDGMVTNPVGTFPYKLTSYEAGAEYVYDYFEGYWQTDADLLTTSQKHNVDRVTYTVITDATTRALALENGEIDICNVSDADLVNFVDTSTYEPLEGYYCELTPNNSLMELIFNCGENSPCQDINLRKAICYCIDVDSIVYQQYGARGSMAKGFANPCWADNINDLLDDDYFPFESDYATAKEYLAQSSYNGETIRFLVNPADVYKAAATLIQAYCKDIGVEVELQIYESALYEEYHKDTTGEMYDMDLFFGKSNFDTWSAYECLDLNTYTVDYTHIYMKDDTLQELVEAAAAPGHSDDDLLTLNDYVEENAYAYAIMYYSAVNVSNDRFHSLPHVTTQTIFGACDVDPDA